MGEGVAFKVIIRAIGCPLNIFKGSNINAPGRYQRAILLLLLIHHRTCVRQGRDTLRQLLATETCLSWFYLTIILAHGSWLSHIIFCPSTTPNTTCTVKISCCTVSNCILYNLNSSPYSPLAVQRVSLSFRVLKCGAVSIHNISSTWACMSPLGRHQVSYRFLMGPHLSSGEGKKGQKVKKWKAKKKVGSIFSKKSIL